MKKITKLIVGALGLSITLSLTGCVVGPWGGVAIVNPFSGWGEYRKARKNYEEQEVIRDEARKQQLILKSKSVPQVIYHIDKNRYLTLENYSNCDDGSIYYHNDIKNIKTKLWFLSEGTMNYKGKFIWAAKNDDLLVLPFVRGDNDPCGDSVRGCARSILSVSNDGGKNFQRIIFRAIYSSDSKNYTIVITDDAIYIKKDRFSAEKYAINSAGEFYNVRQAWIKDELYKEILKLGVPEDALDKTRSSGFDGNLLINKYHYTEAQIYKLDIKSSALFDTLNDSPFIEKLPNIKTGNLGSSKFSCTMPSPKNTLNVDKIIGEVTDAS
ncbi:hypothetical protein SC206_05475 [Rouxiella sp. T17]|uniref:T6SS immunity protein Tli3 family protein n=1 Tax=Rouxiella sp. T17 TaxID=3085684 RepID=UPI002FCB06AA